MVYANQAGTSWPKPAEVVSAVAESLVAPPETWAGRFEDAHRAIARAFGLADPARLLPTPGATSALSLAVESIDWRPGDRVLTTGVEHRALHGPLARLASRGVDLVVLPRTPAEPVVLEALEEEFGCGRVRLLAMTAASNVTGEITPVDAALALARDHGALTLVDGAQVAGWLPLDLPALGADFFAFAGHKGPQAPWGIGGLYVAPDRAMPGYCDGGSVDRAALAGLAAGLAWLDAPERADRLAAAQRRVARIADALRARRDAVLHGPSDPAARMPTLAFTLRGHAPSEVADRLAERGVVASGGQQCAPLAHTTLGTLPGGVVRLSLGPGNDDADVEVIVGALAELEARDAAEGPAEPDRS